MQMMCASQTFEKWIYSIHSKTPAVKSWLV